MQFPLLSVCVITFVICVRLSQFSATSAWLNSIQSRFSLRLYWRIFELDPALVAVCLFSSEILAAYG